MTERERRYRLTEKGRAWVRRSSAQYVQSGKHAEANARYARRKAEARDHELRKELTRFGADVAR